MSEIPAPAAGEHLFGWTDETTLTNSLGTLFTPIRTPSFGMYLYNNEGNDTNQAVGEVTNDTFELAYARYQTFTLPAEGKYNVAYGRGIWVAVLCSNMEMHTRALRSTDGINWTSITLPTAEHWWGIAYGNGRFVITSAKNNDTGGEYFLYSTDGTSWTTITSPEQDAWYGVTFGEDRFIAISHYKSSYSTNGVTWSTPVTTYADGPTFHEAVYGDGTWVAFSTYIYANLMGAVYSTDNGVSWTNGSGSGQSQSGSWITKSAYANGIFACIYTGDSCIRRWNSTATLQGTSNYIDQSLSLRPTTNLCVTDNVFYNVSDNYFARSVDAENWIVENTHLTLPAIYDLCSDNTGNIVAMPQSGTTGLYITFTNKPTTYYCWKLDMINLYDGSGAGEEYVFTSSADPEVGDTIYLPIDYTTGIDTTKKVVQRVSTWQSNPIDGLFVTSAKYRSGYIRYSQGDTTDIPTMMKTLGGGDYWFNPDVSCLTGDTLVTMPDRSTKCLDEIEIGDKVLSINTDTGEYIEDEVIFTDKDKNKSYIRYDLWKFSNNYQVKTVHRHRFYNIEDNCFVYMDRWNIGDHTINEKGEMLELLSHETIQEEVKHYKITTKKYHNYFANGMLTGSRLTKAFDYKDLKIGEK